MSQDNEKSSFNELAMITVRLKTKKEPFCPFVTVSAFFVPLSRYVFLTFRYLFLYQFFEFQKIISPLFSQHQPMVVELSTQCDY